MTCWSGVGEAGDGCGEEGCGSDCHALAVTTSAGSAREWTLTVRITSGVGRSKTMR